MPPRSRRPPLGQHFLRDANALRRIVSALAPTPASTVIEIGAGEGALTAALLASGARVKAIELDAGPAAVLRDRFGACERFELIEGDVLSVDLAESARRAGPPVLVVGNLPYYITSPILRRTLALGGLIETAVFLIQKEVAARVAARRGSRDYAYLSALCRLHAEPELLFTVKAAAFQPPPKVDSAVVRLRPRTTRPPDEALVRFLEAAFRQPRKTLLNNLATLYPRERVATDPRARLRAQQLDVEELEAFWRDLGAPSSDS